MSHTSEAESLFCAEALRLGFGVTVIDFTAMVVAEPRGVEGAIPWGRPQSPHDPDRATIASRSWGGGQAKIAVHAWPGGRVSCLLQHVDSAGSSTRPTVAVDPGDSLAVLRIVADGRWPGDDPA